MRACHALQRRTQIPSHEDVPAFRVVHDKQHHLSIKNQLLMCHAQLWRRKQPQLFTVVALALFSTMGLIVFTGSHLDAVPSLPRRRPSRATRLRLRSTLEQDDFREVCDDFVAHNFPKPPRSALIAAARLLHPAGWVLGSRTGRRSAHSCPESRQ